MSWRYWEIKGDPEKRQFVFTTEPDFRCPHAGIRYSVLDLNTGERTVTDVKPADEPVGFTYTRWVSPEMQAAADALGMDGQKLARMVTARHRSEGGRDRIDGKLTDRCKACGARMENKGYYAYVQRERREDEDDTSLARVQRRIGDTFGFAGPMVRLKSVNVATRKEAKQWAYEEFRLAESVLKEARANG